MKIILPLLFLVVISCDNTTSDLPPEKRPADSEFIFETKIFWHWESDFTPNEKEKIKKYITTVSSATFSTLGTYPFHVHYYFVRSNSEIEPIPWAHTERGKFQAARFYINPDFDYDVIYADWTAPHEISHLAIPFLGKENSWFSEGFATYMQYQIMQKLKIYSETEVANKYKEKIESIRGDYSDKLIFTENANELKAKSNYKAMYWGGANYFLRINSVLKEQEGFSLNDLMKEYQKCCRKKDKNIEMLLNSLDAKLKKPIFSDLYKECRNKSFAEIFNTE